MKVSDLKRRKGKTMTKQEFITVNAIIDRMIGTWAEQRETAASLKLSDRINSNNQFGKMREKLMKIADENGIESLSGVILMRGSSSHGFTKNGKKYTWEGNNGYTAKSRYCGSLYIEGEGTVFTSGTLAKAVEYILKY